MLRKLNLPDTTNTPTDINDTTITNTNTIMMIVDAKPAQERESLDHTMQPNTEQVQSQLKSPKHDSLFFVFLRTCKSAQKCEFIS